MTPRPCKRASAASSVSSRLAKQKRTTLRTAPPGIEGRDGNRRHAVFADQPPAEGDVVFLTDIDVEKVGPLCRDHAIAQPFQPGGEEIARALQVAAQPVKESVFLRQAVGHRLLQVGRRGEGEKLVGFRQHLQDLGLGADEADFPAGEAEDLAGGADLDGALAHARMRDQRQMLQSVEDDMLPDLVAQGDRVEIDAIARQEIELRGGKHRARRIERVVEQHDLRFFPRRPRRAPPR